MRLSMTGGSPNLPHSWETATILLLYFCGDLQSMLLLSLQNRNNQLMESALIVSLVDEGPAWALQLEIADALWMGFFSCWSFSLTIQQTEAIVCAVYPMRKAGLEQWKNRVRGVIKDLLMIRKCLCEPWADKGRTASFLLFCCHDAGILSFFIYCYCSNCLGFLSSPQ